MRIRFLTFLTHRVVGADIFISYRQKEAKEYATALKARLETKYRCFLDEEHLDGDEVAACVRAARRSRMFVLVGTPTVFKSEFIPQEIEGYLGPRRKWPRRLWRRFLPINVDGALNGVAERIAAKELEPVWQPVVDFVGEPEKREALATGPSESVVEYIENAYNLLSASFLLLAGAVVVSTVVAVMNWGVVQLALRDSRTELRIRDEQIAGSMRKLSDTNQRLFDRTRELTAKEEQIRLANIDLARQREEVRLGEVGRLASTASILALQFLSDLGVHPPNGKTRDNRDEQALDLVVRSINGLDQPSSIPADGRRSAEDAINSATADVLTAMNHSYRFRGHRAALAWLRPVAGTRLMISRANDNVSLLWNADDPGGARMLEGRYDAGVLSANGRYAVMRGDDTAEVIELPEARGIAPPFPAPSDSIVPVFAVSDDGLTVLRQGRDGLEVWDVAGASRRTIAGPFVKAIAFRGGSASAVAVTTAGVIEIIDLATGVRVAGESVGTFPHLTISPDGAILVWCAPIANEGGDPQLATFVARIASNGSLVDKHELLRRDFQSLGLSHDAGFFSPNRRLLAVPGVKGRVLVFDIAAWATAFEHTGPPFRIDQIAIDDDVSRLVTVSSENFRDGMEVRVWNSSHVRPFREVWAIDATAFTADWTHERLDVVQREGAFDLQWSDVDSGRGFLIPTRLPFRPVVATISRDGLTACVIDPTRGLHVWRADSGLRRIMQLESVMPVRPALSADGSRLVVPDKESVSIIETANATRTSLALPFNNDEPTSVSPRGTWAVTRSVELLGEETDGFQRGTISVWRVAPDGGPVEVVTRIPSLFHQEPFAAVSDDGALLAIGQNDRTVKLYRHDPTGRERPRLLATFRPPRNPYVTEAFAGLRFTPDGKGLVIAYGSKAVSSRIFPTDVRLLQRIAQSLDAVGASWPR